MEPTPISRPKWRRTRAAVTWIVGVAIVAPSAIVFVVGRLASGLPEALCNPWALQCWIAFLAALVLFVLARSWRWTLVAVAFALWSSVVVLPHAFASRVEATPGAANVRVVETNVL